MTAGLSHNSPARDHDRATGADHGDANRREPRFSGRYRVAADALPAPDDSRRHDLTLHVDVDGPRSLGVVSGTASSTAGSVERRVHFIGRVTFNRWLGSARYVVARDMAFTWPFTATLITRVDLRLSDHGERPRAHIAFFDRHGSGFGPIMCERISPTYREVEVDLDREEGAAAVDTYPLELHPDRPVALAGGGLTLESAFATAGITISRRHSGEIVSTSEAGVDARWTEIELHDSMRLHWDAFANRPQWKLWVLLARLATDDDLGGIMFDGRIAEPGGVDRQGVAVFTACPTFHMPEGDYCRANPPAEAAARRELFFNLVHEAGHAFNLAHSFQKQLFGRGGERAWRPPEWSPLVNDRFALSWMNYPDRAAPTGTPPLNASWFYKRFMFTFADGELLFLRHAPEEFVEMGGADWLTQHARVPAADLDPRLELRLRNRRPVLEWGEPAIAELRLRALSGTSVAAHANLDPSDGLVEIMITDPLGRELPFVPVDDTRRHVRQTVLRSDALPRYHAIDLTMGRLGFHFKEPGAYRVAATYQNPYGGHATAMMHLTVRAPRSESEREILSELFDARLGSVLYVGGTRALEAEVDKLEWIQRRIPEDHPLHAHMAAVLATGFVRPSKVVLPGDRAVRVLEPQPERVVERLTQPLVESPARSADTLGHVWYNEVVNTFTTAAASVGEYGRAETAQRQMIELFEARRVIPPIVDRARARLRELRR
jgi:hypothetical protein